jgi:galactokinase
VPSTRRNKPGRTTARSRYRARCIQGNRTQTAHQDSFDTVLDAGNLRYDLGRIEALASAASEKLECLPHAASAEDGQALRRLHHLVTLVAEEAARVLDAAKNIMTRVPEAE